MDIYSLERFLKAQETAYPFALCEMQKGKKQSHWMWYIFPQLRGLGTSEMSYTYGISDIHEAVRYLSHPILSERLYEISTVLLSHAGKDIFDIMGYTDGIKLQSSMTLFAAISESDSVFSRVLNTFYGGETDEATLRLLGM